MKKKFFDKSLMVEGLSQLKLPGLIFLVISVLGSALVTVSSYLSYLNIRKVAATDSRLITENQTVSILNLCPMLLPVIYLAPFVFCLVLFSFLNNRKGSDFYHSLTAKRSCIYLSFTASILIWITGIILASVFTSSILYSAFGMILNPVFIPYTIFTYLAGAVLVMACMLFSMSITGTFLTNIILFGIILFLPRFIITMALRCLGSSCLIMVDNAGGIANVHYNIPVNLIYQLMAGRINREPSILSSIPAVIYSFVLAIIYISIACILFQKRKSETAGSGAPNRILQHVYRCIVTLPVALMIPLTISYWHNESFSSFWNANGFTLITIAIISLFIYFLYELITTKSAKKMLKSTPVLLVVVGICVVFGVLLNFAKKSILSFTPSSSEIESIYYLPYEAGYPSIPAYNELIRKNVSINNESVKKLVSESLNDNVSKLKSGKGLSYEYRISVGIKLKNGKYAERKLFVDKTKNADFISASLSDSDYLKAVIQLPDDQSITSLSNNYISSQADLKKLWNMFKSEYNLLSDDEKENIAFSIDNGWK